MIGTIKTKVVAGDITSFSADAYVIPQFQNACSYGGVGGAVARSGGIRSLDLFQKFIDDNGRQNFGLVLLTAAGGGNAKFHLHVVSVGSSREDEFNTIQTAFFNVLSIAEKNGVKTIIAPAMGTGIIGKLTSEQSAKAMMSAIFDFASQGKGDGMEITFVIYAQDESHPACKAFSDVLNGKLYQSTQNESGEKEF